MTLISIDRFFRELTREDAGRAAEHLYDRVFTARERDAFDLSLRDADPCRTHRLRRDCTPCRLRAAELLLRRRL